jgi:hypothetical protein
VTKPENQDTTSAPVAFTGSRRLSTALVLSVGAGTLLYGTVLAFPAAAASGTVQGPPPVSCTGSTASISPSATATDAGTASASASSTGTAAGSATGGATGAGASGTASASASASVRPTDCATLASAPASASASASVSASASASAGKSHTPTATAGPTKSKTATIPGKGGPSGPGQPPASTANNAASIPVFADVPTGQYFAYTDVPPGNATYQLPHGTITRAQIIARAQVWVQQQVPYSQTEWHKNQNGIYRQDCSGYVSMAWDLNQNTDFWTGNLNLVSHTIPAAEMLPGDILLSDVHTILFAGWANAQHTEFDYYEEAHPGTVARYVVDAPLAAFLDNGFAPFRYDGIAGSGTVPANPANGNLYSTLAQKASEIDPPGVVAGQPLGLDQTKTASTSAAKTRLSAQIAADDTVGSDSSRNEGIALGVGGAFLLGAGLVLRRPTVQLRVGRRRKH